MALSCSLLLLLFLLLLSLPLYTFSLFFSFLFLSWRERSQFFFKCVLNSRFLVTVVVVVFMCCVVCSFAFFLLAWKSWCFFSIWMLAYLFFFPYGKYLPSDCNSCWPVLQKFESLIDTKPLKSKIILIKQQQQHDMQFSVWTNHAPKTFVLFNRTNRNR